MAITSQGSVRVYGVPKGAAGINVVERTGLSALSEPRYGTTAFIGNLKRGTPGVLIPCNSYKAYQEMFGDPKNMGWHLYSDAAQMTPDAVEGYYSNGGQAGQLWALRLELPRMRSASTTLLNSLGAPVLKITAANPGRWGGRYSQVSARPIIFATARTFTLNAPNVEANQYIGSIAKFSDGTEREYEIVSNTASGTSGEVVFSVSAQYSLIVDNVSGPTTLTGTASYQRYKPLSGTANFALFKPITATATATGRTVTGVGTLFTTELKVGSNLYMNGEARVVDSITSNTTATITEAFSADGIGTFEVDNTTVTGATTTFIADLAVGDTVYVTVGGNLLSRKVAAIASDTALTLVSGFSAPFTTASLSTDNNVITGLTTLFTTELQVGTSYIVDPNRSGAALKVKAITSATSVTVDGFFSRNFTTAQITKQSLSAEVTLVQQGNDGLGIEITAGQKFPATHFGLTVRFNDTVVYQVSDASLDPVDRYYVEPLINDDGRNICYQSESQNYNQWITVESLWDSAYTTGISADVRPVNGSGPALAVLPNRIYTVANLDYSRVVSRFLFPDPYAQGRSSVRVSRASAPTAISGTISSLGTVVTGTGSVFRTQVKPGDYLYDPVSKTARRVRAVISDTLLNLDTTFAVNVPALTKGQVAGFLECDPGYNLTTLTSIGRSFNVTYPELLKGGYDGDLAALNPYSYTQYLGQDRDMLSGAFWGKGLGLVKFALPGVSDVVAQKAAANYAQYASYEFRTEIPSNYTSATTAEQYVNNILGRNDCISVAFPSYAYVNSAIAAGERFVPASGDIMGGEASYANANSGYHYSFAGVKAVMSRITRLPVSLSPQDEQLLNLAGIVCVKKMQGNIVVWGARGPAISPMYDFLHARRIQSNFVRMFLESRQLLEQLFQPNQPYLLDAIIMVLNNWALNEYKKGTFTQYLTFEQAVEIRGQNSGNSLITDGDGAAGLVQIIEGKLNIFIRYVPTGIVEQLSINISPDIITEKYGQSLSGASI